MLTFCALAQAEEDGSAFLVTNTDENGTFAFYDLAAGNYTVAAYQSIIGMFHYMGDAMFSLQGDVEEINITVSRSDEETYLNFVNSTMEKDKDVPEGNFSIRGTIMGPNMPGALPATIPYSEAEVKVTGYLEPERLVEVEDEGSVEGTEKIDLNETVAVESNEIEISDSLFAIEVKTDENGTFVFSNLIPGNYTLAAQDLVMDSFHYMGIVSVEAFSNLEDVNITLSKVDEDVYLVFEDAFIDQNVTLGNISIEGMVLGPNMPGATPAVVPYKGATVKIVGFSRTG